MALRVQESDPEQRQRHHRAQRRAVWEFFAAVEDLRCTVCRKRVDFDEHEAFDRTSLCIACAEAVNQDLARSPP